MKCNRRSCRDTRNHYDPFVVATYKGTTVVRSSSSSRVLHALIW